jgi:nucleoid-associated protein YgaU
MTTKKPDFSDVRSGSSTVQGGGGTGGADFSDVRTGSSTVQGGGSRGAQTYTVASGDTLSHIAQQFYGKASKWQAIFAANRDQLDDPDLIQPGQVLQIPAIDDRDD